MCRNGSLSFAKYLAMNLSGFCVNHEAFPGASLGFASSNPMICGVFSELGKWLFWAFGGAAEQHQRFSDVGLMGAYIIGFE